MPTQRTLSRSSGNIPIRPAASAVTLSLRHAASHHKELLHTVRRELRVIVTDKLRSYAAKRCILSEVEHRQSRYLNNRAENPHQPTRARERQMKRFQNPEQAQGFLSTFESINAIFRLRSHLLSAACYRHRLVMNPPRECSSRRILKLTMSDCRSASLSAGQGPGRVAEAVAHRGRESERHKAEYARKSIHHHGQSPLRFFCHPYA